MRLNKTILTAVFFVLCSMNIFSQPVVNENSIKFESAVIATLVGQDGLIMRTNDGGLTWTEQVSGITNVLNANEFVTYSVGIAAVNMQVAVGENGIILKSVDEGLTWTNIPSGTIENLNDVVVYSPEMIFVCGANGTLLKSVDHAETWVPVVVATTQMLNHIAKFEPSTQAATINAVVVGDSGTFFATTNLEDWYQLTIPTTENLLSVTSTGDLLVAAGTNGTILKSVDKGITWIALTSGVTTKIYDLAFVNPVTVIGSSENGVMVRSVDAGDNWSVITTPATLDLFALNFGSETFGISTGAGGTEIYTIDGGATWLSSLNTASAINMQKETVKLDQNYPNPFNPSTIINYTVTDNSNISMKVYDMTGREVKTLVNSFQNAGTYSVSFNAANLSSGIYFYVLRVNSGSNEITKTMRMILTK
ncbi:MAG: YCF48-related protein [Ignavibacteria bacterium]